MHLFAALERLGPAFTWTTRIATGGAVGAGVLNGNLYLAGGADPLLNYERLGRLQLDLDEQGKLVAWTEVGR